MAGRRNKGRFEGLITGHSVRSGPYKEGIRKLTSEAAEFFGIKERGILREGMYADINVFSLQELKVQLPEFTHDLPAGAGRYIQKASGFDFTLVNGEIFMEGGEPAGSFSGRLLRAE